MRTSLVPWVVDDLLLFAFSELPAAQDGYRWTGPEKTPDPLWPDAFVVIASVGVRTNAHR